MNSETTIVATQYRLQEWAAQIRDCQSRPEGMSVVDWCTQNGITKGNYYYRLRRVREACLNDLMKEGTSQAVVPVAPELLYQAGKLSGGTFQGLDISLEGFSIHVTEATSMKLLSAVLEVVRNAQ